MTAETGFDIKFSVQNIAVVLGALGALAAIISVWVQLVPAKPELEANIKTTEEFSANTRIDGLTGEFKYKGEKIDKLIKITLDITNIGSRTVIGKGSKKNILGDYITLYAAEGLNIVDTKILRSDFNVELEGSLDSLKIRFGQWRTNESLEAVLYFKNVGQYKDQYLFIKDRDIVDGDFVVRRNGTSKQKVNPLNDIIPSRYVKPLKAFGILTFGLSFIMCFLLLVEPIKSRIIDSKWKSNNSNGFGVFVDEKLTFLSKEERELLKSNPASFDKIIWKRYEGDPYESPLASNLKEALMVTALGFILAIGLVPLYVALVFLY